MLSVLCLPSSMCWSPRGLGCCLPPRTTWTCLTWPIRAARRSSWPPCTSRPYWCWTPSCPPATWLLVLSGDAHPATTAAVLAAGADGCLAKGCSSRQVATAIRQLAAGGQVPVAAAEAPTGREPSVELMVQTLTFREREILGLLTGGLTTRGIAQELCLTYQTVRSHIYNTFIKLGVHSQLEAVPFALGHQVVEAPGPRARERRSA